MGVPTPQCLKTQPRVSLSCASLFAVVVFYVNRERRQIVSEIVSGSETCRARIVSAAGRRRNVLACPPLLAVPPVSRRALGAPVLDGAPTRVHYLVHDSV